MKWNGHEMKRKWHENEMIWHGNENEDEITMHMKRKSKWKERNEQAAKWKLHEHENLRQDRK